MLTAQELKEHARLCGADLVGIGSMDRYAGAPKQMDPRYIMPEAKSIIGLGFRIHRGLLRGIEEGTYFAGYPAMGYANINDVYAPIVLREVGSFLEDHGYEALLYQNTSVRLGTGVGQQDDADLPQPDVFLHFRIAGTICGMGEIGHSKVFLSPQFGPRQRLAFILTDAPLQPDPMVTGTICDRCMQCVKECPAGAISANNEVEVTVDGHTLRWGELDAAKCGVVFNTGHPDKSPFLPDEAREAIRAYLDELDGESVEGGAVAATKEEGAKKAASARGNINAYLKEHVPYIRNSWASYHHPAALCGAQGCIRACMKHLEDKGRVSNQFKTKFRRSRLGDL